MIRTGFILLFVFAILSVQAQRAKLPPFQMMQVNGHIFRAQQLPIGKPILLVYFTPGCEHCEWLTKEMLKHEKELSGFSVVMITYRQVADVAGFIKQFNLQKRPNFYAGTEGNTFFVQKYYSLTKLPFMALYTKNGDLVKKCFSEKEWKELLPEIKKLK